MTIEQSIGDLLAFVRKAYIDEQNTKGMRSSGKSAESLRDVIANKNNVLTGEVFGSAYFYQQKFGRKPGKFPPISAILDWIREKGIKPRDNKTTENQLAFLFARKIAESGTDIYSGKRQGLKPEEKIQEALDKFRQEIRQTGKQFIVDQLKKAANVESVTVF